MDLSQLNTCFSTVTDRILESRIEGEVKRYCLLAHSVVSSVCTPGHYSDSSFFSYYHGMILYPVFVTTLHQSLYSFLFPSLIWKEIPPFLFR